MPKKRSYNPFEVQNGANGTSNALMEMEYGDHLHNDDDDDDDDEEEDFVPLVKSSIKKATAAFEKKV